MDPGAEMLSRVDERFRDEVRRYALQFTCEACVHFDAERGACSNGYPPEPHRRKDLTRLRELSFCKTFELY
jgi:hypothetical protein